MRSIVVEGFPGFSNIAFEKPDKDGDFEISMRYYDVEGDECDMQSYFSQEEALKLIEFLRSHLSPDLFFESINKEN